MKLLSVEQQKLLQKAVSTYHHSLPGSPGEEYLDRRLSGSYEWARLGYVKDPLPGHESYQGMLAIPYLRYHPRRGWTCVSIRFRTLEPEGQPKYMSLPGVKPRLYNTPRILGDPPAIGICEGELDALTATLAGLPTVGVPGATCWQPHWKEIFKGYPKVFIFTDGDKPGKKLGREILDDIPQATLIDLPDGEDINSLCTTQGEDIFCNYWKERE